MDSEITGDGSLLVYCGETSSVVRGDKFLRVANALAVEEQLG